MSRHMAVELPVVYLARHGETAWTITCQHTGTTDLPLTSNGERNSIRLGNRLEGLAFAKVLTSPVWSKNSRDAMALRGTARDL
jgi:broad specificity phosphatase PhoE